MAPSRYDWKIVDWDVKPQHNQPIIHVQYTVKILKIQTPKTFVVIILKFEQDGE